MKKSLAFDFGATSIRAILGYVADDGSLVTDEVMRLSHNRIEENGRSRWEFDKLLNAVKETIIIHAHEISSIGVNTWGVDFGIIDKDGNLLQNPVSYRDDRNYEGFEAAQDKLSAEEIFMATGNQLMSINSLYQLLVLQSSDPDFARIDKVLLMPDLINYMLTSEIRSEMTIASTTQLFDLKTHAYSKKILETYDLNQDLFPEIIGQGVVVGSTRNSRLKELREFDIPVISVASHDTASAVLLTTAYEDRETIFLSLGTWSLIGCISDKAVITQAAFDRSLTNECGVNGTNMFFKNLTGLYIVEKLKEQIEARTGRALTYPEITERVRKSTVTDTVNIESAVFQRNEYDAVEAIENATRRKYADDFDYFKVVYLSMAHKFKETIELISEAEQREFKRIHCIGGGAKSDLLCGLIAEVCGMDVLAGPFEATAYGNLLIQQTAIGACDDLQQAVDRARAFFELKRYKAV